MTAPDDMRARFEAAWNRSIYSRCAVPNESFKEIAEQFYRAAHADLAGEVRELVEAATELRQRQRDYLSGPKEQRSEEKGRLVGVAAARVDAALAKFTQEKNDVLP